MLQAVKLHLIFNQISEYLIQEYLIQELSFNTDRMPNVQTNIIYGHWKGHVLTLKVSLWKERVVDTSDKVSVGVVIRSVELVIQWKQCSDSGYGSSLTFHL